MAPRSLLPPTGRALLCLLASACYTQSRPLPPGPLLRSSHPAQVRVVPTAGPERTVYAPELRADTVFGHAGDSTIVPVRRPNTRLAYALADIRYVTVTQFSAGKTVLYALGVPVLAVTAIVLGYLASGGCIGLCGP